MPPLAGLPDLIAARRPAPAPLDIVQELVNTRDVATGDDLLATAAGLRRWLEHRDLLGPRTRTTSAHAAEVRELREALRALLLVNTGALLTGDATAAFDRVAQGGPLVVTAAGTAPGLAPAERGVEGALGRIFAIVATAAIDGSWKRLKACRSVTCHGAFYDRSRNNAGAWCSMELCGTPAKMRQYRARKSGGRS